MKERYPTFTDALRDLDDAVSMLFLFSNLPTNHNLPLETITTCEKLTNEWQHYIIRTNSLRKSFLSIKGIYYQAEIQGQDVLWLVPYKFAQNVPVDVDFRIMHTFVEFYSTLVGFVLFRLYTQEGLVYPPKFDEKADARGAGLRAFSLEARSVGLLPVASNDQKNTKAMSKQMATLGEKIASLEEKDDEGAADQVQEEDAAAGEATIDTFQPVTTNGADVLLQPHMSNVGTAGAADPSNLFAPFTFFLSRETPRQPLEFLLRSFGCKRIGWDLVLGDGAFTENESDPSITHQIVDRPPINQTALPPVPESDGDEEMEDVSRPKKVNGRIPGRTYVQPQYIWDCVNAGKLLSPSEYGPGALLPPHLSPWVKIDEKTYDPTAPGVAGEEESEEEDEEVENGMDEDLESGDEEEEEIEAVGLGAEAEEEEESEDEEEKTQQEYQRELEAEAAGVKLPAGDKKKKDKKKKSKQEREEEEQKEMQKIMMSRRKRKLYEKMQYSNKKKEDEVENLREKRRKLDKEKKRTKA